MPNSRLRHCTAGFISRAGLALAIIVASGCALAPQEVSLNQQAPALTGQVQQARNALIRVVDKRGVDDMNLGHRGGPKPEDSLINATVSVRQALTVKLKESLEVMGFGQQSAQEALAQGTLKVQLDINTFQHRCNEAPVVTECALDIGLRMTVVDGDTEFGKGFRSNESRTVLVAPGAELNQRWINDVLDRLWQHMFSDPELRNVLGMADG